jgi:hypothetical protein
MPFALAQDNSGISIIDLNNGKTYYVIKERHHFDSLEVMKDDLD